MKKLEKRPTSLRRFASVALTSGSACAGSGADGVTDGGVGVSSGSAVLPITSSLCFFFYLIWHGDCAQRRSMSAAGEANLQQRLKTRRNDDGLPHYLVLCGLAHSRGCRPVVEFGHLAYGYKQRAKGSGFCRRNGQKKERHHDCCCLTERTAHHCVGSQLSVVVVMRQDHSKFSGVALRKNGDELLHLAFRVVNEGGRE